MVLESIEIKSFRLQIEVSQKTKSDLSKEVLKNSVKSFLKSNDVLLECTQRYDSDSFDNDHLLKNHVEFFDLIQSATKCPVRYVLKHISNASNKINSENLEIDLRDGY